MLSCYFDLAFKLLLMNSDIFNGVFMTHYGGVIGMTAVIKMSRSHKSLTPHFGAALTLMF